MRRLDRTTALILAIALGKLVLNLACAGRYGYFRDELYYIACSEHLDWGYVDHPPFSIAVLALTRALLGDSLHAIRFPAALAGAATVVLTGLLARKLGGGRYAQLLAAGAAALSPVVLGNAGRFFSMNAFDLLFWALGSYLLAGILVDGKERLWLVYGLVAGLGVLNKYSMLFFGLGTVVGLVLTRRRRDLLHPWIWAGGALALALIVPHALWQVRHDFPTAEFIHNASTLKNAPITPARFLIDQAHMTGFGQTLLWLAGLAYFFADRSGKSLRAFGWMFLAVTIVMIAGNSKSYYLTPIYSPFLAAGALAVERVSTPRRLGWLGYAVVACVVVFSLVALPFAVPLLAVDDFIAYQRALGRTPQAEERSALADLPQYYADMFGWEELVARIAVAYERLDPEERRHAVIFARNYGQAGAIDFFGPRHGLPRATSLHNSYWFWGPGDPEMRAAIVIGEVGTLEENLADLEAPDRFAEVELAATTDCGPCMPYENRRMIFLCRGPRFALRDLWPTERDFI